MKAIKKDKLKFKHIELHYPQENMICHNLIILTKLHFSIHWQLVNWTVNNNYMTLLRALHHTHDGF